MAKAQISYIHPQDIRTDDNDMEDVLVYEEEDIKILFKALSRYIPTESERLKYEILLENLDELLTREDN